MTTDTPSNTENKLGTITILKIPIGDRMSLKNKSGQKSIEAFVC